MYRRWLGIHTFTAAALALALGAPQAQAAFTFQDVVRDAPWALGSVAELTQRGIFNGYADGTFRPSRDVSRIETIVAAVRHMGLKAEAESLASQKSRLSALDSDLIKREYAWAIGYVEAAEDNNLLIDEKAALKPGQAADRVWATTVLVRALGLERQAEAAMTFQLPFDDAKRIPAAYVGYVAVAVQYGLVSGYEDNTFRPERLVSRAELATLLDRAGDAFPNSESDYMQATGIVSGVNGQTITITQSGISQPFYVGPDATVVRSGRLIAPKDLVPGDELTALMRGGEVVLLNVTKAATVTDGTKTGTIASAGDGMLTLLESGGKQQSYKVHENVVVYKNGALARWNDVRQGDQATATVSGGFVTRVEAEQVGVTDGRFMGTIKAVTATQVTVTVDGLDTVYKARNDVTVIVNNVPGSWSQLKAGDQATFVVSGGLVFHISLTQAVETATIGDPNEGYVTAVYPTQLTIAYNGQPQVYTVSPDAHVFREGEGTTLSGIKPGDKVRFLMQNNRIMFLTVLEAMPPDEPFMKLDAVYQGHVPTLDRKKMSELTVAVPYHGNSIIRTFPVSTEAVLTGGTVVGATMDTAAANFMFNVTKLEVTVVNGSVILITMK
ncbi:MAG TPA: S-layer homology domain-containing protein [Paenibacillus sp.]|nr:S-layer homology domain-containing protein [Paenibacillus sp.]